VKSLLRDNWKIDERPILANNNIFGFDRDVALTIPRLGTHEAETSFGVILVGDSLVRVHLLSPYLSADSRRIIPGTLIILIRERLPRPDETGQEASADKEMVYSSREVTQRARILSRPEPAYTDEARNKGIKGVVVIKAVFSSSGQVTNIRVIQGLPYGLTEEAVAAVRQIKFEPAVKDGRRVSQHIQIEYYFNL
jgi:TonB family protein